jgi:hypothetical protein
MAQILSGENGGTGMTESANEPHPIARRSEKIWRYMDLAKFISLLSSESLYFACPHELDDPYEGSYPKSHVQAFSSMIATRDELVARRPGVNVQALNSAIDTARESFKRAFEGVKLKFGVTCWHNNEVESEAMWKLYSASGQGIAIESNRYQLRESILEKESLKVGDVRYMDFENDPIEKGHENYGLFLKRKSFEHERELRATILLKKEGKGALVKCDLDALITQVHVSPFAPKYFKDVVEKVCSGEVRKLCKPVLQSSLFDKPGDGFSLNPKIEL